MSTRASSVTRSNSAERKFDEEEKGSVDAGREKRGSPTFPPQPGKDDDRHATELPESNDLRTKETTLIKKRWWLKTPRDPYPSLEEVPVAPLADANWLSKITFHWIQPMLTTGYQRTLVPTDLWKMPDDFQSGIMADRLMNNFERRRKAVEDWNKALEDGTYKPSGMRRAWWRVGKAFGGSGDGKRKVGLALALSDTFFWKFWAAGILKIFSDGLTVTSPLVTRAIITFATDAYAARRGVPGYEAQPIGVGIGLAFGLWGMQIVASLCLHSFFYHSAGSGVLIRATLIAALYRKAMKLSGKARTVVTNGRLVNHIGTDCSRIDFCAGFFHMSWTAPITLIVIMVILLVQIGASCLTGLAFLLIMIPPQSWVMKKMFGFRRKAMVFTDKRARLIGELLSGMRVLKFFAWEIPYLGKLHEYRSAELAKIRKLLIARAGTTGVAMSLPTLATVIAFVTYANTGHSITAAKIFTSLTLFQLVRMPLMMLPMSLSTITDAKNALNRLTEVLLAEERETAFEVDRSAKYAVTVEDADFQWESPPPDTAPKSKKEAAQLAAKAKANAKTAKKEKKEKKQREKAAKTQLKLAENNAPLDPEVAENSGEAPADVPDTDAIGKESSADDAAEKEVEPMQLRGVNLQIPYGQLCAIVGSVGSGKSSLLNALVGEMKRNRGRVAFGGSIAYAAQQAWMQSCSLKANVLFGRPYDEARYRRVIHDACLEPDIEMLPHGDETEIGEKGVTLSGGQKQRVNIARALYSNADVVLLDDPLSAVDAHVGKFLFDNAICGSLAGKTRLLVTHALHFLPRVDYIICLENGRVSQEGTYADLVADENGAFSKIMAEFGGDVNEKKVEEDAEKEQEAEAEGEKTEEKPKEEKKPKGLMQEEERAVGSVSGEDEGIYAMLGVLQAVFSFMMGVATTLIGYNVSKTLHHASIEGILHAPMSFFDTTPLGRIQNRFSKDIDTIDNTLPDSFRMAVSTAGSVVGAIVLIAIVQQWFLLVVAGVLVLYAFAARFYRQSARELKRLDNLLRSSLYAHFSETLSGMATVRAYGESEKFLRTNESLIDLEDRAYYLTVVNQRWLGLRLDFFGSCLTFAVAMFSVGTRYSVSPAETGLVLSYILTISQAFSWMVRQAAEVENDLNSVERLLHYANKLDREAPAVIEDNRPPEVWPAGGAVEFKNVVMSYRPDLPPVLKGLSLSVKAGEKIGVVGRTGAGKSTIMQTLFRMVEISSGSIEVDGVDISKIGLADLRKKIAILPQDAFLFAGTVRTNLDPFGEHEDAELYDALKRAWLVEQDQPAPAESAAGDGDGAATPVTPTNGTRFTLDLAIEDEGGNLSVGERSLVSLARALVKNSKIIVLDEATASVDYATDSRIQATIRKEFSDKTLLVIAHRLRTIIDSDRVLVMDAGQVAEYDTPLNLFHANGIFRSMCDRSNISEQDIQSTTFA
ncbi:hypothetical protein JCM8202v2_005849 [Rhodotorula sphaerocarpa]